MIEFLKPILSEKTLKDLTDKLGEDVINSINEKTKDFTIDVAEEKFIPKSKFDTALNQIKDYKEQIEERDKQLKALGEKAEGNEELTKKIQELQTANETTKTEFEAKLSAREKEFAIDTYLLSQRSKNPKAVKALLDLEKVQLKDGKLEGLEDQIKQLKESDDYLFEVNKSKDEGGKSPGGTKGSTDEFEHFRKLF